MTKKSLSKLLSVILTLAICATTVFGCLMTVNAAENPSYVITGAQCNKNDTAATATVEFTVPDGMISGVFTIDNTDSWYSSVAVSLDSTLNDGDNISIDVLDGVVLFNLTDASDNSVIYTTLTFKLDFVFTTGITSNIDITLSDLDFSSLYEVNYTEFNGTNGVFSVSCEHEYQASGTPVYTDDTNGYEVYSSAVCSLCGESKEGYQVLPVVQTKEINAVSYSSKVTTATLLVEGEANSEENPYIIDNPGQLFALSRGELTDGTNTIGKSGEYFKVADGIDAFYMNGGETVANLTTAADVKTYFEASGGSRWWSNGASNAFNGHFDGNGVVIYGLYSATDNTGLFPFVDGNTTIKNLTLKNSYISASNSLGVAAIVGVTVDNDTHILSIENITVANNYIAQTHATSNLGAGAIVGYCYGTDAVQLNNCLVYGNTISNAYTGTDLRSGLVTYSSGGSANMKTQNIVALGVTPWTIGGGWNQYHIDTGMFVNIFTDQDIQALYTAASTQNTEANAIEYNINGNIKPADMLGANAAAKTAELTAANKAVRDANGWSFSGADLDWNTADNADGIWHVGEDGEYPSLLKGFEPSAADSSDEAWKLLAVNIEYENDGSFSLNFHYTPAYASDDVVCYVPSTVSKDDFIKLTDIVDSPYAGDELPAGSKMFTIENISAKDIDKVWLPTIITTAQDGSEIVYSATEQISVEDYAEKVISGEAFYANSTTEAEKTADQKVAAALINYGYAAKAALASNTVATATTSTYSNPKNGTEFTEGSGTESDPYIVETADQFAAVARGYVVTEGKYFKVKDGVKAFYLNGGETVANLKDADAVKEYFTTNGGSVWWDPTSGSVSEYFKGNFDGNGVTIYGLYTGSTAKGSIQTDAALFPKVDGSVTIKNINLKNSYIEGGTYAAGIVAFGGSTAGVITIENCSVEDCYIKSNRNGTDYRSFGGVLLANTTQTLHAYNCIVADNIATYAYSEGELMPVISSSANSWKDGSGTVVEKSDVNNLIVIGSSVCGQGWALFCIGDGQFKNVYTDSDLADLKEKNANNTDTTLAKYNVVSVSKEALQGVSAMETATTLDWKNIWCYGAEGNYPSIALVNSSDADATEFTSTYSGYDDDFITDEGVGSGTETDPYIISTAGQLASVCAARVVNVAGATKDTASPIDTTGLYFKVADGLTAFYMNGGETVAALTSATDVKSYFEANGGSTWWSSGTFNGNFDGNGATVYGIYCPVAQANSALFHTVGTEATIKNIAVKNSYFASPASGFAGGIVATTSTNSGTLTIENCTVANNYIHSAYNVNTYYGGAGAIVGCNYWGPTITIDNCLVYGNDIGNDDANTLTTPGLIGFTGNKANVIKNTIAIGVNPFIIADVTNTQFNTVKAANAASVFTNVYTDMDVSVAETLYGVDYTDHITQLTTAQMQGKAAKENMSLTWGTDWYVGNRGDYPSLTPVTVSYMPADLQAQYDALVLDNYDDYNVTESTSPNCYMYASSLNLKANPYIAFTFAFQNDYRDAANKANVNVTLTTIDGKEYTTTAAEMTNNTGAGRYHLYRFTDVPVEYLCKDISVKVEYKGTTTELGTFSVEGFALEAYKANRILPCEYYATRYEAAKALLFYTQMINARYGSVA